MSGATTKFPTLRLNSVAPANDVITAVPDVNSARNRGSLANTTWVSGDSFKEPLPLTVNVAVPESLVRTVSPGNIVDSAGTSDPLTYTFPALLSEPSASFS